MDSTSNYFCTIKTKLSGGLTKPWKKHGWNNRKLFLVWQKRFSNLLTVLVKLNTNIITISAVMSHT